MTSIVGAVLCVCVYNKYKSEYEQCHTVSVCMCECVCVESVHNIHTHTHARPTFSPGACFVHSIKYTN